MRVPIKRRKIKSQSKIGIFIVLLILVLAHKFFYMWLQDDYMIGSIKFSDISVLLSIAYTLIILVKYGIPTLCRWRYWIYAYFILVPVSAITAWFFYDQSIIRGIFAQRCQMAYLFLFLGVERLLEIKKIHKDDLIYYIYIMCWLELLLCTIQYILYSLNGTFFMRVGTNLRYESVRLYFDPGMLLIVAFHSLESFIKGKSKVKNLIFLFWTLMFLMVITKMRMMTGAFLVCMVVGLLISHGKAIKKIFYMLLGGIAGFAVLSKTALFQDLMNTVMDLSSDANYGVRIAGRSVFISELLKSPITGRGYPSISSRKAYAALKGYLFVDNGIWGLIYSYGIIGLFWWIGMWGYLTKKAWAIRKHTFFYFLYFLYYTIGIMTDFAWFWTATFSFSIVSAMLFEEIRELGEIKTE